LGQALPFLRDLAESRGAAKSIYDIIEKKSEISIENVKDKIVINDLKGKISFKNICFSYPQRNEIKILDDLCLELPVNKTIALCGSSGICLIYNYFD
jgi:ATP-binding cassette subfamily B (MDR/TAP) protein 1